MDFKDVQKVIDKTDYWDSRVNVLECNYFSDEVKLVFKNDDCLVTYNFKECYRVVFDHLKSYKKDIPIKEMSYAQIPYFLTEIIIDEICEQEDVFLTCKLCMFPLNVEIWCKDVTITQG